MNDQSTRSIVRMLEQIDREREAYMESRGVWKFGILIGAASLIIALLGY